jgi:RNA polymerase sigma factor (TIGR02999 family)
MRRGDEATGMNTPQPRFEAGAPPPDPPQAFTDALAVLRAGAPEASEAMDRLMPLIYDELRRLAHRQLAAEPVGHTLSTTALVHEAYLRLADQTRAAWSDRRHFLAVAACAMRRILVDYARQHRALMRGGPERRPVALDELDAAGIAVTTRADELLALDEALDRLGALDERLARLVELRYFAGLTEDETAEVLGVAKRTVARDWTRARGWLYQELRGDGR